MLDGWQSRSRGPLALASVVILAYLAVELAGAIISGSLALLADAAHTGSDIGALGLALFAAWVAGRPHTAKRSFGFLRAEVLAALVNGALLLAIAVFIFVEAGQRMADPPDVRGGVVSAVAAGGLVANAIAAAILLRSSRRSLNVRGALVHVLGDAIGSAGAIVAGLLVLTLEWHLADPIVSVFIGLILVYGALRIVAEATHVLLEGTPSHVDVAALREDIERVGHVRGCHDLHTWTITSGYDALSAHVMISDECVGPDVAALQEELRGMLRDRYGIAHVTVQLERTEDECEEEAHVPEPTGGNSRTR